MKSATTAGWPAKVRRQDGTLVLFDIGRIEAAVARAAREGAYDDLDMPVTVARAGRHSRRATEERFVHSTGHVECGRT